MRVWPLQGWVYQDCQAMIPPLIKEFHDPDNSTYINTFECSILGKFKKCCGMSPPSCYPSSQDHWVVTWPTFCANDQVPPRSIPDHGAPHRTSPSLLISIEMFISWQLTGKTSQSFSFSLVFKWNVKQLTATNQQLTGFLQLSWYITVKSWQWTVERKTSQFSFSLVFTWNLYCDVMFWPSAGWDWH